MYTSANKPENLGHSKSLPCIYIKPKAHTTEKGVPYMPLYDSYVTLYRSIQQAHPEMSRAEIIKQLTHYVEQILKPKFSEKQTLALFNHMLFQQGKPMIRTNTNTQWERESKFADEPGKCANGKYLPGFIDPIPEEQKALRRAQSTAVRKAAIEVIDSSENLVNEISMTMGSAANSLPRWYYPLFMLPSSANTPEEKKRIEKYNAEIVALFGGKAAEGERQKWRNALKSKNPKMTDTDVEKALRARRAQLVMNNLRQKTADSDQLDAMLDPELPPEIMAEQVKRIYAIQETVAEIGNYLSNVPMLFDLSAEDQTLLKKLENLQSVTTSKLCMIWEIANPAYEFLDHTMLHGLNHIENQYLIQLSQNETQFHIDPWDENEPGLDPNQIIGEALQSKWHASDWVVVEHPQALQNEKALPQKVQNNITSTLYVDFLHDAFSAFNTGRLASQQSELENYGFLNEKGDQTCYMVNNNFNLEQSNNTLDVTVTAPVVFERHGRYGMFQRQPDGSFKAVDALAQFNYKLKENVSILRAQMEKADPPGHHGKNAFRQMRDTFDVIASYIDTYQTAIPLQRAEANMKEDLNKLIQKANAYIQTKQASLDYIDDRQQNAYAHKRKYNLTRNEKWDVLRTDMANALIAFARAKLHELELAAKVNETVSAASPDPKNRIAEIASKDSEWLENERKQHLGIWLQQQLDEVYTGKNAVRSGIPKNIINGLKPLTNYTVSELLKLPHDKVFDGTMGRMIAAEQIMLENTLTQDPSGGKLRKFYADAKDDDFVKLGRKAICKKYNIKPEELHSQQLLRPHFFSTVKLKEIAAELLDYSYLGIGESAMAVRLRGQYLDPIHPMRGPEPDKYDEAVTRFVQNNITSFDVAKQDKATEGSNSNGFVKKDVARNLLADCVIAGVVQKERERRGAQEGPGVLENMLLNNPEGILKLHEEMLHSELFHSMIEDKYMQHDPMKYEDLAKILDQRLPQQIADREYLHIMQTQNKKLYDTVCTELSNKGIDLAYVQFRTLGGIVLDPSKPEDLARIVGGRPLYAAQIHAGGDKTAEFILHGGLKPQIVSTAVRNVLSAALKNYIGNLNTDLSMAIFSKAVGSPFDTSPDKQLDLNTPDGVSYVLAGNPVIVGFSHEHQAQFCYDAQKSTFTAQPIEYQAINHLLQNAHISADGDTTAFHKPDGSKFAVEKLYDQQSDEYKYLMNGSPIIATAEDGHQLSFKRLENGTFASESTAHNHLISFLNGEQVKKVQGLITNAQSQPVPQSNLYDDVSASVLTFVQNMPKFNSDPFLSDHMRFTLTDAANNMTVSATRFLSNMAHKTELTPRRSIAEAVLKLADTLRSHLTNEEKQRNAGRPQAPAVQPPNENPVEVPISENKSAASRENITAWLYRYQNYLNNGNKNNPTALVEYISQLQKNGIREVDSMELKKRLPYKANEYTVEQLRTVGIDPDVLTGRTALDNFLNALEPEKAEASPKATESSKAEDPSKVEKVPKVEDPPKAEKPEKIEAAPKLEAPANSTLENKWYLETAKQLYEEQKKFRQTLSDNYMRSLYTDMDPYMQELIKLLEKPLDKSVLDALYTYNARIWASMNTVQINSAESAMSSILDFTSALETALKKTTPIQPAAPQTTNIIDDDEEIVIDSSSQSKNTVKPQVAPPKTSPAKSGQEQDELFKTWRNGYLAWAKELAAAQRKYYGGLNLSLKGLEFARTELEPAMHNIIEILERPIYAEDVRKLRRSIDDMQRVTNTLKEDFHRDFPTTYEFLNALSYVLPDAASSKNKPTPGENAEKQRKHYLNEITKLRSKQKTAYRKVRADLGSEREEILAYNASSDSVEHHLQNITRYLSSTIKADDLSSIHSSITDAQLNLNKLKKLNKPNPAAEKFLTKLLEALPEPLPKLSHPQQLKQIEAFEKQKDIYLSLSQELVIKHKFQHQGYKKALTPRAYKIQEDTELLDDLEMHLDNIIKNLNYPITAKHLGSIRHSISQALSDLYKLHAHNMDMPEARQFLENLENALPESMQKQTSKTQIPTEKARIRTVTENVRIHTIAAPEPFSEKTRAGYLKEAQTLAEDLDEFSLEIGSSTYVHERLDAVIKDIKHIRNILNTSLNDKTHLELYEAISLANDSIAKCKDFMQTDSIINFVNGLKAALPKPTPEELKTLNTNAAKRSASAFKEEILQIISTLPETSKFGSRISGVLFEMLPFVERMSTNPTREAQDALYMLSDEQLSPLEPQFNEPVYYDSIMQTWELNRKLRSWLGNLDLSAKWNKLERNIIDLDVPYRVTRNVTTQQLYDQSVELLSLKLRTGNTSIVQQLDEELANCLTDTAIRENLIKQKSDKPLSESEVLHNLVQCATIKALLANEESTSSSYGVLEQTIRSGKFQKLNSLKTLMDKNSTFKECCQRLKTGSDLTEFISCGGYKKLANAIVPDLYKQLQETKRTMSGSKTNGQIKPKVSKAPAVPKQKADVKKGAQKQASKP